MPDAYEQFRKYLRRYHAQVALSEAFLPVAPETLRAAEKALLEEQFNMLKPLKNYISSSGAPLAPAKVTLRKEIAPRPEPDTSSASLEVHALLQRKGEPVATSLAHHFRVESGGGEFLAGPESQGLGDDFYTVLGIAQNIDHLAIVTYNDAPLRLRFAIPENYEQIISDLSQRLDQWPGQFPQTQRLLADMSAAIKDQQLVSGLKQALHEQAQQRRQQK